jgi:hypothetical protein
MRGISPIVWRRLLVSSQTSVAQLHEILQMAFDWDDDHLHAFHIHGVEYGIPRPGGMGFRGNARTVHLSDLRLRAGEKFVDTYDFSAPWECDIRLQAIVSVGPSFREAIGTGRSKIESWRCYPAGSRRQPVLATS